MFITDASKELEEECDFKMKFGRYHLALAGIICLTIIEAMALSHGINGTLLSMVIGSICTIVTYAYKTEKEGRWNRLQKWDK